MKKLFFILYVSMLMIGCSSYACSDETIENVQTVESAIQQGGASLNHNHPCHVVNPNYENNIFSDFYAQYIAYLEDSITEKDYFNYLTLCMNADKDDIYWVRSFIEACEVNSTNFNRREFEVIKEDFTCENIHTLISPHLSDYSAECIEIVAKMIERAAKGSYQSLSVVDIQQFEEHSKDKQYLQALDLYFKIIQSNQISQEIVCKSQSTGADCYDEFEERISEIAQDAAVNAVIIGIGMASLTLSTAGTATTISAIGTIIGVSYVSIKMCCDVLKAYKSLQTCLEDVSVAYWDETYLRKTEDKGLKLNKITRHIDNIIFQDNIIASCQNTSLH